MACVIIKLVPVPRPCSCACAQPPAAEQAAPAISAQADASNDGGAVVPFASMAAGTAPATTDPGTNNTPETVEEEKSGSGWWWALGAALGLGILVKFSGNDKKNKSKKKRK